MCDDRSVAWEWSNSHVYWAFNRCMVLSLLLLLFFIVYSLAYWIFFLLNNSMAASSYSVWMAFSRWCRCHWQHLAVFVLILCVFFFFHWSLLFCFFFPVVVVVTIHLMYVCFFSYLFFCVGHFPIFFFRWIVNCYCIWERERIEKMRVYVKTYTHGSNHEPVHDRIQWKKIQIFLFSAYEILLDFVFCVIQSRIVWKWLVRQMNSNISSNMKSKRSITHMCDYCSAPLRCVQ